MGTLLEISFLFPLLLCFILFFFSLSLSKRSPQVAYFWQVRVLEVFAFCLIIALDCQILQSFELSFNSIKLFHELFAINLFTFSIKLIIELVALGLVGLTYCYDLRNKLYSHESIILIFSVVVGSYSLTAANSFVSGYLALEMQTIPLYVLIASFRLSKKSVESSLKYFILSVFSSAVLLYSFSLIYYTSGLLNFSDLTLFLSMSSNPILRNSINQMQVYCLYTGLTGLCISLFFKLSAAPFHFWAPDVYEGAPISVTFMFSTITKLSVFVFLVNVVSVVFAPLNNYWSTLLLFVGIISILVGMFGAFYYSKITKIVAFGATSHVGYILVALSSQSPNMLFSVSFYFISYLIATFIFFTLWLNITKAAHAPLVYVQDLSGFSKVSMPCSVLFAVALFSFAGIPPFAGFIAKVLVIQGLVAQQYVNVAIIILTLSAVSAVYYLRFVRLIFFANSTAVPLIFLLPNNIVLCIAWFFSTLLLLMPVMFFII